jgi:hypothetical protein
MKRGNIIGYNNKIVHKNKLNVGECKILEYRQSKSEDLNLKFFTKPIN